MLPSFYNIWQFGIQYAEGICNIIIIHCPSHPHTVATVPWEKYELYNSKFNNHKLCTIIAQTKKYPLFCTSDRGEIQKIYIYKMEIQRRYSRNDYGSLSWCNIYILYINLITDAKVLAADLTEVSLKPASFVATASSLAWQNKDWLMC